MDPYHIIGGERTGRWLITCDHASNCVPETVGNGDLGISAADMARHIAFDVGAAGLAVALAERLGGPALLSNFSRLVIDPNRSEDDPTLLMRLYDGTIIAANRHADEAERDRRLDMLYRPYHAAYARLAARHRDTVIVSVHSFTPRLNGRAPRPWQVGVLYSHRDDRLSRAVLRHLGRQPDLCVGDNEPYSGHLPGDAIDRHALAFGRHNTLIELRNDLIGDMATQEAWADRLAPVLVAALADIEGEPHNG